jgi:hypothetical protein
MSQFEVFMSSQIGRPEFVEKRLASRINIDGYQALIESIYQKDHIFIENITSMGFLAKCDNHIRYDQKILVHLPVIGGVLAEIVWQKKQAFGARFCEPIPISLFAELIDQLCHQPAKVD